MESFEGSDGCTLKDRLVRYGQPKSCCFENLSFGQQDGRSAVIELIIADGDPSRIGRAKMFNPSVKIMGC